MKKILSILFLILLTMTLNSCILLDHETRNENYDYFDDGYIRYMDKAPNNPYSHIYIIGVIEPKVPRKHLVIPATYNGLKIVIESQSYRMSVDLYVDGLEKIYFSNQFKRYYDFCSSEKVSIMIPFNNFIPPYDYKKEDYGADHEWYVTYQNYCTYKEKRNERNFIAKPANVSYYYNYEDSINDGYYWIDDYDNELIDFTPSAPIREGYTFKGWYKEPECLNKWDFNIDIVPEKEYDENGEYVFNETKLYAKWELN